MSPSGLKRERGEKHPYLSGNFAPITKTLGPTPCTYTGTVPSEFAGGEYVRNGANPVSNSDLGRDAHWFDGDGMLSGVIFERNPEEASKVKPKFVNQYILTDLYLSARENHRYLQTPILPSITTLVNPASTLLVILLRIARLVSLFLLSHLPGSHQRIKKISVANTHVLYHDGRALATCESGPPIRVQLPALETVGWYDGNKAENEPSPTPTTSTAPTFGGTGSFRWMKESTTGHPKVDSSTGEMLLFHCTFLPPYVHYSVIPQTKPMRSGTQPPRLLNAPVLGVSGAKMMHDFGVSQTHTVIMDLPLCLDPLNLLKGQPIVSYNPEKSARFGVFPRHAPAKVRWFDTKACCILHTANTWDEMNSQGDVVAIHMLACRLTSASLLYSAGDIPAPPPKAKRCVAEGRKKMPSFVRYDHAESLSREPALPIGSDNPGPDLEKRPMKEAYALPDSMSEAHEDAKQCHLYHYIFSLTAANPTITTQHALSSVPFEFPTLNPAYGMRDARYVYGCSTSSGSFCAALGKATKIDVLLKIDVRTLARKAEDRPPRSVTGCIDTRSVSQILADNRNGASSPIAAFKMPDGWFAQEAGFVARENAASEDDGYLAFYTFDEAQLDENGECAEDAVSELWILEARGFSEVVARVRLPQRVPYGLHGSWFSEKDIQEQRPISGIRRISDAVEQSGLWAILRRRIIRALG